MFGSSSTIRSEGIVRISPRAGSMRVAAGRGTWCRDPDRLSTRIEPPWSLTMRSTIVSPSPLPCALVVKPGTNRFDCCSAERLGPSFVTAISSSSPASAVDTVTRPRTSTASSPFLTRFTSTCRICPGSAGTSRSCAGDATRSRSSATSRPYSVARSASSDRQSARLEARRREAAELGELLEQPLQRLDLLADRAHRLVEDGGELRTTAARSCAAKVLDRDGDRRERVLDLVRDAARHLAPRRVALARDQPLDGRT